MCLSCSELIDEDYGTYSIMNASQTEIHFFHLTTCSRSKSAMSYISEHYPDIKIKYIEISDERGEAFLKVALKEYKLGNSISTPLICCGNECIQGWDSEKRQLFDTYATRYTQKLSDEPVY